MPSNSILKTNGIYFKTSNEIFEFDVENYDKYYSEKGHPALKGLKPKKDTTINFNRFYYFHFNDNGIWSKSGGFYSKQEMLSDFKAKNTDIDNNLYEISNDTLFLESYNSYRKKLEYSKAIVKKDTIFVSDIKNKASNTPYVFYSIEN